MRRRRNRAKLEILRRFERNGWQYPEEVRIAMGWRCRTAMFVYLRKFFRWGLLCRRLRPRLEYHLTARGRARLAWLRNRARIT